MKAKAKESCVEREAGMRMSGRHACLDVQDVVRTTQAREAGRDTPAGVM